MSIPRKDSKVGSGHKGFSCDLCPDMSVKEAAQRRDFTINTLALNPLTGKIHDPFNGVVDIRSRILRVTDPNLFGDDPLRVLRGIQFAARFNLTVEDGTFALLKKTAKRLNEVSQDRFLAEWSKLLLKSQKPSIGLKLMQNLGILPRCLQKTVSCEQDSRYHPEGSVWNHTLLTVDQAANLLTKEKDQSRKLTLMFAALLHDVGKPTTTVTTEKGITSPGHAQKGIKIAEAFLLSICFPKKEIVKAINLVSEHLSPTLLYLDKEKVKNSAIRRLAARLSPATIDDLLIVAESDHKGRGKGPFVSLYFKNTKEWLEKKAAELACKDNKPVPFLTGKDLVSCGFMPGKDFGFIIEESLDLQDSFEKANLLGLFKNLGQEKTVSWLKEREKK